jgi:hypothetical protein
MTVAGTGYAPWHGGAAALRLPGALLERFQAGLNEALPALALSRRAAAPRS